MKHPFLARTLTVVALGLSLLLPMRAQAQVGASGIPDMSDFAGLIAKSAQTAPKKDAPAQANAMFSTGLTVPNVKPGQASKDLVRLMREAVEKEAGPMPALIEIENAMPQILVAIEGELEKNKVAKRDMGVAYGLAVLTNYETATKTKVPDAPSLVATKSLASAFSTAYGAKIKALAPAAKEKLYETLIMSAAISSIFADQLDESGKTEDAQTFRDGAGEIFEKLVGVPADQMKIGKDGRISGLADG